MNNLTELVKEYCDAKTKMESLHTLLFHSKDYQSIILERLIKVCRIIRSYRPPIQLCGDDFAIEEAISNMTVEQIMNGKYPCTYIKYEITNDDCLVKFEINIEAIFRGGIDNSKTIIIPVNEDDFESYCEQLTKEANSRKIKKIQALKEVEELKEKKERELLKKLQEKYN